ncbi:MAG: hypothetical protein R3C97_14915 [Geminicoccaceae bacterium]
MQDGITETNHGIIDYLLVTSTDFWDVWPTMCVTSFRPSSAGDWNSGTPRPSANNEQNRQYILDTGATIRELTKEQRAAWVEAMKPVWEKFVGDIGQDVIDAAVSYNSTN